MLDAAVQLRARIYRARDIAHSQACQFRNLDAGQISLIASLIAAPWAFNRTASKEQLEQALLIVSGLVSAALLLERLEPRDA
jgi:hypothetical protein